MNPVFSAARQATGTVDTPREVAHPPPPPLPPQRIRYRFASGIVNIESVKGKRLNQVRDGRTTVKCQMPGQDVAVRFLAVFSPSDGDTSVRHEAEIRSEAGNSAHGQAERLT